MSVKKKLMRRFAENGAYDEIFDKHYREGFNDPVVRERVSSIIDMINQDSKWTVGNDAAGNIETNEYTKDDTVYKLRLDEDKLWLSASAHRGEHDVFCYESVSVKYNDIDKIKQAIALEGSIMDELEEALAKDQEDEEIRHLERQEKSKPMLELIENKLNDLSNNELADVLTDAFFNVNDIDGISTVINHIWDTLSSDDDVELNKWLKTFGWRIFSCENDDDVNYVAKELEKDRREEFFEENPDATEEEFQKDLMDDAIETINCDIVAERLSDGKVGMIAASDTCPADLFFNGVGIDCDEDMVNKSLKYVLRVDRDGFLKQLIDTAAFGHDRVGDKIIEYLNNK